MKTILRTAVVFVDRERACGRGARVRTPLVPRGIRAAKPVTLTGKVTKVEWTNPHIFIYIDVPDEKTGAVVNWALELGGPNALLRLGWKRDSLKTGDLINVEGSLARNGSPLANAKSIVMVATGQKMLAGSSDGTSAAEE